MAKTGIVLINIGSPSSTDPESVGRYLKKFLMDKRVVDIPFLFRWILVHWLIVPKRAHTSARNYQKIWLQKENMSPLIKYSQDFADSLQCQMGGEFIVKIAMQCSDPSIPQAFAELSDCDRILAVPMYPQFSEATTGGAIEEIKKQKTSAKVIIAPVFFKEFARAQAIVAKEELKTRNFDHYLFSFHGLPERQILQDRQCRLDSECCKTGIVRNCYRAQCFETAKLIAQELGLKKEDYSISFQSRLGRAKWMQPYTSEVVSGLAKTKQSLAVLCPSFVVDCLETLEEIGMGEAENFKHGGGQVFHQIPCPGKNQQWVEIFKSFVEKQLL